MPNHKQLNAPWMVAVWPGMGEVALSAGYYLLSKLRMHQIAEFSPEGLFDIEHVDVHHGLIRPPRRPRSRLFAWRAPEGSADQGSEQGGEKEGKSQHDLVVFLGEAQPPQGKYQFCESLIELASELGVQRVFTFAAMGTQMHPEHRSRVFAVGTDQDSLQLLPSGNIDLLQEGQISGLNGVLLGAALSQGLPGVCLLGEMPHMFAQLPYPKASLAVLNVFTSMANIQLDTRELSEQATAVERKLGEWLTTIQESLEQKQAEGLGDEGHDEFNPPPPAGLSNDEEQQIEDLFEEASRDRTKAYELKRLLDQLDVFANYENRFLDLFQSTK